MFSLPWWLNMEKDPEFQYNKMEFQVGEDITILIEDHGIEKKELAKDLGISKRYLEKLLIGFYYSKRKDKKLKKIEKRIKQIKEIRLWGL